MAVPGLILAIITVRSGALHAQPLPCCLAFAQSPMIALKHAVAIVHKAPATRVLMANPGRAYGSLPPPSYFRLYPTVAHDRAGHTVGIQAYVMAVFNGGLHEWDLPTIKGPISPFSVRVAHRFRKRLTLYYNHDFGWLLVPTGWRVLHLDAGADGEASITFVSPNGPARGWLAVGVSPGCQGCVWSGANGLIPIAQSVAMRVHPAYLAIDPPVTRLVPTPSRVRHPDTCTAIYTYQPASSPIPIHAIRQLSINRSGLASSHSLHVALPRSQNALVHALIRAFRWPTRCDAHPALHRDGSLPRTLAIPRDRPAVHSMITQHTGK